jgi:hypothetical protein
VPAKQQSHNKIVDFSSGTNEHEKKPKESIEETLLLLPNHAYPLEANTTLTNQLRPQQSGLLDKLQRREELPIIQESSRRYLSSSTYRRLTDYHPLAPLTLPVFEDKKKLIP